MKPYRIILVRHGESEGNIDENLYDTVGDSGIPLTMGGIKQSEKVSLDIENYILKNRKNDPINRTRNDYLFVYTSYYLRTRQTCDAILDILILFLWKSCCLQTK